MEDYDNFDLEDVRIGQDECIQMYCDDYVLRKTKSPIAGFLYNRIRFYIDISIAKSSKQNYVNGLYWHMSSWSDIQAEFPMFTRSQIRTAINKLIENDLLISETNMKKMYGSNVNYYSLGTDIPKYQNGIYTNSTLKFYAQYFENVAIKKVQDIQLAKNDQLEFPTGEKSPVDWLNIANRLAKYRQSTYIVNNNKLNKQDAKTVKTTDFDKTLFDDFWNNLKSLITNKDLKKSKTRTRDFMIKVLKSDDFKHVSQSEMQDAIVKYYKSERTKDQSMAYAKRTHNCIRDFYFEEYLDCNSDKSIDGNNSISLSNEILANLFKGHIENITDWPESRFGPNPDSKDNWLNEEQMKIYLDMKSRYDEIAKQKQQKLLERMGNREIED